MEGGILSGIELKITHNWKELLIKSGTETNSHDYIRPVVSRPKLIPDNCRSLPYPSLTFSSILKT